MKKRLYFLIPIVVLLALGSLMISGKAASITDPQNDVIGLKSWTEDGGPKFDCNWLPLAPAVAMIDIEKIEWLDTGVNYTVNITFYGTPNATLLESSDIVVYMYFLINGTSFPDDLETVTPEAHLILSSLVNGTVTYSNGSFAVESMTVSGHSLVWTFSKDLEPITPAVIENWDVVAGVGWEYSIYDNATGITYDYQLIDHYNLDFLADSLTVLCELIQLKIPGYSLIIIGAVSIITIGVIFKKKFKK